MNKAILMGRLTRDPEVRYTQNSLVITNFTLAIDRRFSKQGEEKQTDFIPIVTFGRTAEFCEKYFKKGQQVLVVGRIQTRSWDDNEGKRRYATEVVSDEVYFADSRRQDNDTARSEDYGYYPQMQQGAPGQYGPQDDGQYGSSPGSPDGQRSAQAGGSYGAPRRTPAAGNGTGAAPAATNPQSTAPNVGDSPSAVPDGGTDSGDEGFVPIERESDLPF